MHALPDGPVNAIMSGLSVEDLRISIPNAGTLVGFSCDAVGGRKWLNALTTREPLHLTFHPKNVVFVVKNDVC